jgi:NAD(P)-dependent dehydrogenase (short-subunit alcohol dehydrogenase family)
LRTEEAAAGIRANSGNPAVDAFAADVSSQAEVRRLATGVLAAYPRLDVLVNNAGGYWAHRHVTAEGLERTFAVNHLAPFLLTNLLLDRLKASVPARAVTVASGASSMGRIDFDDLQGARGYSGQRAYNQSKLANVIFSNELARRLEGTGVTANSLDPGVVHTNFGAEDQAWWFTVVSRVIYPLLKTPAQGAQTSIYLAASSEVERVTGQYFVNRKPRRANPIAYDAGMMARLWQVSADLVGLKSAPA